MEEDAKSYEAHFKSETDLTEKQKIDAQVKKLKELSQQQTEEVPQTLKDLADMGNGIRPKGFEPLLYDQNFDWSILTNRVVKFERLGHTINCTVLQVEIKENEITGYRDIRLLTSQNRKPVWVEVDHTFRLIQYK